MRSFALATVMLALAASPSGAGFRAYGQVEEIRDGQQSFLSPYDISGAVQAGDGKTALDGAAIRMRASSLADISGLRANASAMVREEAAGSTLGHDYSRI